MPCDLLIAGRQPARGLTTLLALLVVFAGARRNGLAQGPGDAPTARIWHTGVWTGTEMIVWGGWGSSCLQSGGQYAPAGNAWTGTGAAGAPSARQRATVVWTGGEMIVWGGDTNYPNLGPELNDGGRYNPGGRTWTPTTTNSAPGSRYNHTAVWTGNEMIVWGGVNRDISMGSYLNDGGRYDPATDSWRSVAGLAAPGARGGHSAVWTGERMMVWGGMIQRPSGVTVLNDGGQYDPGADSWTPTASVGAPGARAGHTAVWTGQEIIVWGGGLSGYYALGDGGRYDSSVDVWAPVATANAPAPRTAHTAVWTGTEMVVWGGRAYSGPPGWTYADYSDGGRYNPVNNTWTPLATNGAPTARSSHSAVWTGTEMIVWGGRSSTVTFNDGARYNPSTDSWAPLPTNAAPPLSISAAGNLTLSWPSPSVGHVLAQNSDLTTTSWITVTNTPALVSNRNEVTLPMSGAQGFFRLR